MEILEVMGDNILCKRLGSSHVTKSGVVRGSSNKQKSLELEVTNINKQTSDLLEIKKGDIILISRFSGVEVELNVGEIGLFIKPHDILAKIKI